MNVRAMHCHDRTVSIVLALFQHLLYDQCSHSYNNIPALDIRHALCSRGPDCPARSNRVAPMNDGAMESTQRYRIFSALLVFHDTVPPLLRAKA